MVSAYIIMIICCPFVQEQHGPLPQPVQLKPSCHVMWLTYSHLPMQQNQLWYISVAILGCSNNRDQRIVVGNNKTQPRHVQEGGRRPAHVCTRCMQTATNALITVH
jgi:hypothetical protein